MAVAFHPFLLCHFHQLNFPRKQKSVPSQNVLPHLQECFLYRKKSRIELFLSELQIYLMEICYFVFIYNKFLRICQYAQFALVDFAYEDVTNSLQNFISQLHICLLEMNYTANGLYYYPVDFCLLQSCCFAPHPFIMCHFPHYKFPQK